MFIYSKDIQQNALQRAQLLTECEQNPQVRAEVKELFKRDILFAFNLWFWTFDTRTDSKHLPFITYGFQDEAITRLNDAIATGRDVFIDKSRDMGATWLVLGTFTWRFLTQMGEEFRVGSRKEDFVDKVGDMGSLFEKIRYLLNRLPWFLLPPGFDAKRDMPYMKVINKDLGSAIIGEATNENFARGDRKKAVLFDEFQTWEKGDEAWRSASDATPCKVALGTPQGEGNKFAELHRTEEVKTKIHLIWYTHPKKASTSPAYMKTLRMEGKLSENQVSAPSGCYVDTNGKIRSEWYDYEVSRRTKEDVSENLDCDYLTSGRPVFDTEKCKQAQIESKPPMAVGNLQWLIPPHYTESGDCDNQDSITVEFVKNQNGLYQIWEYPEEDYNDAYCIGADTAEGLEQGDYDATNCISRVGEFPKKVAALREHLRIHEYAEELAKFGTYYKNAVIAVERNNHGHGVILQLQRIYRNLWYKEMFTKGYPTQTDRIGFETTQSSKAIIIGTLGKAISLGTYKDPDEGFWAETLTFVENNGVMEAQGKSRGQKCFDDRIMATAIALWCHLNSSLPSKKIKRVEYSRITRMGEANHSKLIGFIVPQSAGF
jgi:hypothetical protein